MEVIKSFKIDVSVEVLSRLKQKLQLAEFPKELEDAQWTYGSPLKHIQELTKYWIEKYDWRAAEANLNKLPQFQTEVNVDGFHPINIHFVHQKSEIDGTIPLLFVHGWPGNFIEVTKLLQLLKGGDGKPAFHVVAPSLPNYGFSSHVPKKGFGLGQHAETCHKLMLALGYDEYGTNPGGDWGAFITRVIGLRYPAHCKASHINMIYAKEPTRTAKKPKLEYVAHEKEQLVKMAAWESGDERGYFAMQSTKPATLAFSLHDSPTALLAWIYDKLHTWTDNYPWTPNEILTWISIYVFSTAGPSASIYTYYEATHDPIYTIDRICNYINIPLGIADFPKEVLGCPRSWRGGLGPVVCEKEFERGGHLATWECPMELAGHVCEMFGKGGGAEGTVTGRNGY